MMERDSGIIHSTALTLFGPHSLTITSNKAYLGTSSFITQSIRQTGSNRLSHPLALDRGKMQNGIVDI